MKSSHSPRHLLPTLIISFVLLLLLSLVPWSSITGNFFKDFNLLEDISTVKTVNTGDGEIIDPELLALIDNEPTEDNKVMPTVSDSIVEKAPIDSVPAPRPVRHGDLVIIEDYSPSQIITANLAKALRNSRNRTVRIGMIGDSYIEGDVFSQDIREKLQALYGGRGAGYMMMHSDIPGFRQSVIQTDKGWTAHDIRKSSKTSYKWLGGEHFTGNAGAMSTYKGVSRLPHASAWNQSTFLFVAPADGSITITTDSGSVEYPVAASDAVQCITVNDETAKTSVKNNVPGLVALGLWLNDNTGVTLDCMSLRGNSGITHRVLDSKLTTDMSAYIPYDLIIVEYGINALSSGQKDYSKYGSYMEEVVNTLRACYPEAGILMMGIGDRGQKSGTEVHSIATAQNMVDTQREVARRTGVAFWDTREAMGGNDAIVDWRERKLVNADYIHLNHKGGEALAQLLVDAIKHAVEQ